MGIKLVDKRTECRCDSCNTIIFATNKGIASFEIRRSSTIELTAKQIDAKELYLRNGKIYCSNCAFWLNINEIIGSKDLSVIQKSHKIVELMDRKVRKHQESLR